jgi:hypothetical protein
LFNRKCNPPFNLVDEGQPLSTLSKSLTLLVIAALSAWTQQPQRAKPAGSDAPLTNDSVVQMVKSGMAEALIVQKIKTLPANFKMDVQHLQQLSEQHVPSTVVRAMLGKATPTVPVATAPAPSAAPPNIVKDPGPALAFEVLQPSALPANLDKAIIRQGTVETPMIDRPQKIMFVKTDATDPKEAIANALLMNVGMNLLTMGMYSQMKMWNPYVGETFTKMANLGKGVLVGHGTDTAGFEYETLPGTTATASVKQGATEIFVPMNPFITSADMDVGAIQPVLLRATVRPEDQVRLVSARHVTLKEHKNGRFDLKPTINREENQFEQNMVPIDFERVGSNVFKIVPKAPLTVGEYVVLFRKKSDSGAYTSNVSLKPSAAALQQAAIAAPPVPPSAGRGMLGAFGRPPAGANPMGMPEQPQPQNTVGFIAWDFRVLP